MGKPYPSNLRVASVDVAHRGAVTRIALEWPVIRTKVPEQGGAQSRGRAGFTSAYDASSDVSVTIHGVSR